MATLLKNKWALTTMVILCWALATSFSAGYYYYQYDDLVDRMSGTLIAVDVGLDYGNTTRIWANDTQTLIGMSLFDITRHIANVTHTVDPLWGIFVESINDVRNSSPHYWMWWKWNGTAWTEGGVGADSYIVMNGEIILWYYSYCDPVTWKPTLPP